MGVEQGWLKVDIEAVENCPVDLKASACQMKVSKWWWNGERRRVIGREDTESQPNSPRQQSPPMSDDEQSVSSSTYSSDAEEEEIEEYADAEAEGEGEAEGDGDGEDVDGEAENDGDAEAEGEGDADAEAPEGEGEGEESDDEDEDGSDSSSDEDEEEDAELDDAEGDDDLEDDAGDLEAALENMEAMDDEAPDEEMITARKARAFIRYDRVSPSKSKCNTVSPPTAPDVPVPAVKQATATQLRRKLFVTPQPYPKSYGIDPVCALPHPVATHCLAASLCMTYLCTGSEDGFVRCYDFFAGINGKTYLTAPQRHHCGIGEGTAKAGVLKMWWENYAPADKTMGEDADERTLSPVHCMAMQGDALWSLSGTAVRSLCSLSFLLLLSWWPFPSREVVTEF